VLLLWTEGDIQMRMIGIPAKAREREQAIQYPPDFDLYGYHFMPQRMDMHHNVNGMHGPMNCELEVTYVGIPNDRGFPGVIEEAAAAVSDEHLFKYPKYNVHFGDGWKMIKKMYRLETHSTVFKLIKWNQGKKNRHG